MARVYIPLAKFVYNEISKIKYNPHDRDNYLGDVGELIIEYGIKWFFWNNEFIIGRFRNQTFNMKPHHRADKDTHKGGIDFYLKFRTHWKTYRIFIEVKNWDDWFKYPNPIVSNHRYKKQILSRFTKYDKFRLRKWLLVIPKGYIKNIKQRCDKDNIIILPLEHYFIPEISHVSFVQRNYKYFLNDFSNYINLIVKKDISGKSNIDANATKTEKILNDDKKGMPVKLNELVNNTTADNIYKERSKQRQKNKR